MATKFTQLQNIVLALDGSDDSWAALDLLCDLPLSPSVSIHVVSALLPREASTKAWVLMAVLEQAQEPLNGTGVQVSTKLLTGYPAEEVMGYCEEHQPDLIMIGATGLRATLGIPLGGVAQQIVEYACCPVLVARAPYAGLGRVLLTVDGSWHSEQAVEYLSRFPLPGGSKVQVMFVLQPMDTEDLIERIQWPGPQVPPPVPLADAVEAATIRAEGEEREARVLLARIVDELAAAGLDTSSRLVRGDAATEIIDAIQEDEVDLVVAGSRGLSQVRGWLLGSVSRKLVHYAGCSALIVKQPDGGAA